MDQDILNEEDILAALKADINEFSFEKVAYKIAVYRYLIKHNAATRLITALCKLSGQFEEPQSGLVSSFRMMVITVEALIKGLKKDQQFAATIFAVRFIFVKIWQIK